MFRDAPETTDAAEPVTGQQAPTATFALAGRGAGERAGSSASQEERATMENPCVCEAERCDYWHEPVRCPDCDETEHACRCVLVDGVWQAPEAA